MGNGEKRATRSRIKAVVGRTLPDDFLDKTIAVLSKYNEVPLYYFTMLWTVHYGDEEGPPDFSKMGFDNGMVEFFQRSQLVDFSRNAGHDYIKLKPHLRPKVEKKEISFIIPSEDTSAASISDFIFDQNQGFVWLPWMIPLLERKPNEIVLSLGPLDLNRKRHPEKVDQEIKRISAVMKKFPDGIPLSNLWPEIRIDKFLFNRPSQSEIVANNPELFFVKDAQPEMLVFDGTTRTYDKYFLNGNHYKKDRCTCALTTVIAKSFMLGIYGLTLLLIRRAGLDGLKISAWKQSMLINFKPKDTKTKKFMDKIVPLNMFLMWASKDLIVIKSHPKSMNDLRVHLPAHKIDYAGLMTDVQRYLLLHRDEAEKERYRNINPHTDVYSDIIRKNNSRNTIRTTNSE